MTPIQFSKLSAKAKRIAIAKDVLQRLDATQYKPKSFTYVEMGGAAPTDLQRAIAEGVQCRVCALGGAICSVAFFENQIKAKRDERYDIVQCFPSSRNNAGRKLVKIFGKKMLAKMEQAFEGTGCTWTSGMGVLSDKEIEQCNTFSYDHHSDLDRFRAIWTQIKDHGDFDPTRGS